MEEVSEMALAGVTEVDFLFIFGHQWTAERTK